MWRKQVYIYLGTAHKGGKNMDNAVAEACGENLDIEYRVNMWNDYMLNEWMNEFIERTGQSH